MALTPLIIISALIFNLSNQTLQIKGCDHVNGYFIEPASEFGYKVASVVINSGKCYYTLNYTTVIELNWHYSLQTGREDYGVVHDDTLNVKIKIPEPGLPRYYLY